MLDFKGLRIVETEKPMQKQLVRSFFRISSNVIQFEIQWQRVSLKFYNARTKRAAKEPSSECFTGLDE